MHAPCAARSARAEPTPATEVGGRGRTTTSKALQPAASTHYALWLLLPRRTRGACRPSPGKGAPAARGGEWARLGLGLGRLGRCAWPWAWVRGYFSGAFAGLRLCGLGLVGEGLGLGEGCWARGVHCAPCAKFATGERRGTFCATLRAQLRVPHPNPSAFRTRYSFWRRSMPARLSCGKFQVSAAYAL